MFIRSIRVRSVPRLILTTIRQPYSSHNNLRLTSTQLHSSQTTQNGDHQTPLHACNYSSFTHWRINSQRQHRTASLKNYLLSSHSPSSSIFLLPSPIICSHFSTLSLSPREKLVLKELGSIVHPKLNEDIVYSGHVRTVTEREGHVSIILPLDESYRELKKQITDRLTKERIEWLQSVRVNMEASSSADSSKSLSTSAASGQAPIKKDGLSQVRHIIAVSSCKGGVGKSTVAVNLAYALSRLQITNEAAPALHNSQRDVRVGILDADVYGPSLPTMVSPRDTVLRINQAKRIFPLHYEGVKLMSYGFVTAAQKPAEKLNPNEQASAAAQTSGAFIRGPLASAAVRQMSLETEWGELDYLIVDLPPGTGDIQLTLTQQLKFRGAVVVTTPQKLALVDVEKGLEFFSKTSVPVLGLVENMAYFICDSCEKKHRIFGEKGVEALKQIQTKYGVQELIEIPMHTQLSEASDSGDPFILATAGSTSSAATNSTHQLTQTSVRSAYEHLAQRIHDQVSSLASQHGSIPKLTYDATKNQLQFTSPAASPGSLSSTYTFPPRTLRLVCQCAGCVDELTGRSKLVPERIPADIRPLGISPRGNYAVAIHWSDGHASSIYPFQQISKLVHQNQNKSTPIEIMTRTSFNWPTADSGTAY